MMDENVSSKLTLDELANWSPWPRRLLSLDPYEIRTKTPESILREFDHEKWGKLFEFFATKREFALSEVEATELNLDEIVPCYERQRGFYLARLRDANNRQLDLYRDTLKAFADEASCLVELGAGYGSKILGLSEIKPFDSMPLFAAEYTQSGCDLIQLIARKINKQVHVGRCDFYDLSISGIEIPEQSIIFTSYSVHYVPKLRKRFVDFIYKFKPKAVVHFEPCDEYFDDRALHGLMCKRYMELNGYTKNIASIIEKGCQEIGAKFEAERNVFGSNPFLPYSAIKWVPQY